MGGGHGHGHGITYKGVTIHQPKRWHTVTGKGLCAVMCYPINMYNFQVLDSLQSKARWPGCVGLETPLGRS
ncbi:hypothetical protein SASPL_116238 [Salvia splendens]|uniref:Uncharacterized protein n=1 Tax=Salvia splendens TaxID=180675 RepID=A0A8X8ZWK3_SALSN|nr:hypothetical protein SASPL_116238 [Salvia splendens]